MAVGEWTWERGRCEAKDGTHVVLDKWLMALHTNNYDCQYLYYK